MSAVIRLVGRYTGITFASSILFRTDNTLMLIALVFFDRAPRFIDIWMAGWLSWYIKVGASWHKPTSCIRFLSPSMSHEHRYISVSSAAAVLSSVVVCRLLEYDIAAPFIHTILHPCDRGVLNPESAYPLNTFASSLFSGLVYLTPKCLVQYPYSRALSAAAKWVLLHLPRKRLSVEMANLDSSFVKADAYCIVPISWGYGKWLASLTSSSVASFRRL